MAKIVYTKDNLLVFDDGTNITCDHYNDCCEYNYAKFDDIDDICRGTNFDTSNLTIEIVEGAGFRFGNLPAKMFFVPCYSEQNGYYSHDLSIFINNEVKGTLEECEEIYC